MGGAWKFLAVGGLLALTACSMTLPVLSVVGEDEVFTGTTTSNGTSGKIELSNGKGTRCIGEFVGTTTAGHGLLTCDTGERAQIQYTNLGMTSGHGFGITSAGRTVKFTFGLTREEAVKYLGQLPAQTAASTGAATGGASPSQPPRTLGSGTGFFITRQGHVLTNAHVVDGCKALTATPLGGAVLTASVVSSDKANDLAVLATGASPKAIALLRGGQAVRQGEAVVAYGFPLSGDLSSGGVTTNGTVSALAGLRDDTRYLQFSAPVQPGNSGGPLLDTSSAVVGVVSARLRDRGNGPTAQNVNFALKVEVVRTFLGAVGVAPETTAGGRELSMPDVVERARAFTVYIECKG